MSSARPSPVAPRASASAAETSSAVRGSPSARVIRTSSRPAGKASPTCRATCWASADLPMPGAPETTTARARWSAGPVGGGAVRRAAIASASAARPVKCGTPGTGPTPASADGAQAPAALGAPVAAPGGTVTGAGAGAVTGARADVGTGAVTSVGMVAGSGAGTGSGPGAGAGSDPGVSASGCGTVSPRTTRDTTAPAAEPEPTTSPEAEPEPTASPEAATTGAACPGADAARAACPTGPSSSPRRMDSSRRRREGEGSTPSSSRRKSFTLRYSASACD